MAEDHGYSSRSDHKRKFDDPDGGSGVAPPRRSTGFSAPISSPPSDKGSAAAAAAPSYNSVPPPPDGIELAKQRAQEIAARLFSAAEAKRPKVDNGAGALDGSAGTDQLQKFTAQSYSSQVSFTPSFSSTFSYGASKKIEIPNGRVGVIIGKGGETIRYLQVQTGAKIQVTRDMDADPNSQTRSVEMLGTQEQVTKAEQLINDVLAQAEAGASDIVSGRRTGAQPPGAGQFQMKIANNKVGLVIGKGGETIKTMQAKSGARIQVIPLHLPPGDTSTERTVYIDGTEEQIEAAKQLVIEVISESRARNPTAGGYRAPRPQTQSWTPQGAPAQQPTYGYMQSGAYPGAPPVQYNYNISQSPYPNYPPPAQQQPASSAPGYDYYSQQQQQQQQVPHQQSQSQPVGTAPAPTDTSTNTGYNTQPQNYSYSYSYSGTYPGAQQGYSQTGYDQSYGTNPPSQDGTTANYSAPSGTSQALSAQPAQTLPPTSQPPYASQPSMATATAYPGYGNQVPAQQGYAQSAYMQKPAAPAQHAYGQQVQQPGSATNYSQPGYSTGYPTSYGQPQYGESYGSTTGGYGQMPPAYSKESSTAGHGAHDQTGGTPAAGAAAPGAPAGTSGASPS